MLHISTTCEREGRENQIDVLLTISVSWTLRPNQVGVGPVGDTKLVLLMQMMQTIWWNEPTRVGLEPRIAEVNSHVCRMPQVHFEQKLSIFEKKLSKWITVWAYYSIENIENV